MLFIVMFLVPPFSPPQKKISVSSSEGSGSSQPPRSTDDPLSIDENEVVSDVPSGYLFVPLENDG